MKKIYLMCGAPGTGKSTIARQILNGEEGSAAHISRDAIRFSMVSEEEEYFSKEKEVFEEFIRQIQDSMDNNDVTIIDATHLTIASRRKVLSRLHNLENFHLNIVESTISFRGAMKWNNQRTGREHVPEYAIRQMCDSYESVDLSEVKEYPFPVINFLTIDYNYASNRAEVNFNYSAIKNEKGDYELEYDFSKFRLPF